MTGIILAIFTAFVIIGGVHSIGRVTGYMVPFMAFFYIITGLVIVFVHINQIPHAITMILQGAFNGTLAVGGFEHYPQIHDKEEVHQACLMNLFLTNGGSKGT